jgi:hypothetical protein
VSRGGRVLLVASLLLAVVSIVYGTLEIVSALWLRMETTRLGDYTADSVVLRADCGSLRVVAAPPGTTSTTVERTSRWSFDRGTAEASLTDGVLTVTSHCSTRPPSVANSEDLVVTVPAATAVDASAMSGVHVQGLTGAVSIGSNAGVVGSDLGTTSFRASTSFGDVVLSFTAPPGSVDASTDSGDIEVVLPKDGTDYLVESDPAGSVRVRTDPESRRVLRLTTASGDIIVRYPG